MTRTRVLIGAAGGVVGGFGVVQLLANVPLSGLLALAAWMVAAVVIHDGVIAPVTVGVGVLLTRLPVRARRYAQGGLVAAALITAIALPLIARRDTQPRAKAILLRDYGANLALLLGLVAAVAVVRYVLRVVQDQRASGDG